MALELPLDATALVGVAVSGQFGIIRRLARFKGDKYTNRVIRPSDRWPSEIWHNFVKYGDLDPMHPAASLAC